MITFKEFLLENDQTLQEYAEMHCGPFLKEFGGLENYLKSPIYRGSNSLNEKESIVLDWQNKKIKFYFGVYNKIHSIEDYPELLKKANEKISRIIGELGLK